MTYLDPMNEECPVSILTMTRGKLHQYISVLPEDVQLMTEKELRKHINPTNNDYCLRTSFWREYELAVKEQREYVTTKSIVAGICSEVYFYKKFVQDIYRLAWLVKPCQTYMKEIEAVLMKGTERLWELMDLDIEVVNPKTGEKSVDAKLAAVLLDTIKMVENRAKGHAMLRSEMRAVQVNVSAPHGSLPGHDHNTLQRRMKELSDRMHGTSLGMEDDPGVEVIDDKITVTEVIHE